MGKSNDSRVVFGTEYSESRRESCWEICRIKIWSWWAQTVSHYSVIALLGELSHSSHLQPPIVGRVYRTGDNVQVGSGWDQYASRMSTQWHVDDQFRKLVRILTCDDQQALECFRRVALWSNDEHRMAEKIFQYLFRLVANRAHSLSQHITPPKKRPLLLNMPLQLNWTLYT